MYIDIARSLSLFALPHAAPANAPRQPPPAFAFHILGVRTVEYAGFVDPRFWSIT